MLLVGTLPEALEVHKAIARDPAAGLVPVGIHLTEGYAAAPGDRAAGAGATPAATSSALVRELGADTIAVCGSASAEPASCAGSPGSWKAPASTWSSRPSSPTSPARACTSARSRACRCCYVEEPKLSGLGWLVKNVIDRVLARCSLLVAAAALRRRSRSPIRLSDRGPVFFRQPRVGREGKMFQVWKFRTMYADAEDRLARLDDQNESDGLLFKIKNDPRVSPVGRFLRATSLDELPQLINVLRGEMSLVGPRPLPADDGDFLGDVRRRLLVRPGMTGLWQVSGRSDLSWDDAVRLDLYYVDNWSLAYDLRILWRTIGVVVARKGAY